MVNINSNKATRDGVKVLNEEVMGSAVGREVGVSEIEGHITSVATTHQCSLDALDLIELIFSSPLHLHS